MKLKFFSIALLSFSLFFTACNKQDEETPKAKDLETEVSVQADDHTLLATINDDIANDANAALSGEAVMNGRVIANVCDATYDIDSTSNTRKITITYNGNSCNGARKRTGTIILSLPKNVHWKDAGAALTITIQNLKVTRVLDSKSITINGTQVHTNVSGGLLVNLATLQTITHTITSSDMNVTFDDGAVKKWQVARKRVFTYNNGIVITESGTHTEGTQTNVAEWGTNRFGNAIVCSTPQALVIRQDCNFRLVSGSIQHSRPAITSTITFGLDATGKPTSCPGLGSYYLKVVAEINAKTYTVLFPY